MQVVRLKVVRLQVVWLEVVRLQIVRLQAAIVGHAALRDQLVGQAALQVEQDALLILTGQVVAQVIREVVGQQGAVLDLQALVRWLTTTVIHCGRRHR